PAGNDNWQQSTQKSITWTATGVTNVNIEFSSDNGATWTTLATSVPAGAGSSNVMLPAVVSEQCKIRVTDATDVNSYQSNKAAFSLYDTKEVTLLSNIPAYTAQKNSLPLRWNSKGFPGIRIEYTINNGSTWNLIADTLAQAKSVRWEIPAIAPATCRIRVSDKSDAQVYAISNPFNIGEKPLAGGPYSPDENTVMLLHFDQLHRNEAIPSNIVTPYNSVSFEENFGLGLDYCGKITNDGQGASSCIKLEHHPSFHLYGDWTIEFWFKINSWGTGTTEYPLIFEKPGTNFSIGLSPTTKNIRAGYDLTAGGSVFLSLPSNSLSSGKWYHFLFVRNTATNEITVQLRDADRKLLNTVSRSFIANQAPKMDTQPVLIGGVSMGSNIQFDGWIDELRVSNVVRDFQTASPVIPGRKLLCFPNPTSGKVRVTGLHSTDESLIFTNLNGSVLLKMNLTGQPEAEMDISHLPAGVYVLQVTGNKGISVEKMVKK
ncbi:MAG TPA: T9SS type A sorting domain-containing protein, partial [Prolixibacteraceae bacterium]|nr:T9SS type A sorting domain-containing protein [Prolixibacteraceae bacterium]